MFYMEGNYCYCRPDYCDGEWVVVGGSGFWTDYDERGNAFITGNSGQTYILVS